LKRCDCTTLLVMMAGLVGWLQVEIIEPSFCVGGLSVSWSVGWLVVWFGLVVG
jgi:hypothetical protein